MPALRISADSAMEKIAIAAISLGLMQSASALNKCTGPDGKVTYTDYPCAESAKSASVRGSTMRLQDADSGASPIDSGKEACKQNIAGWAAFKDPSSVTIKNVLGGSMAVIDFQGGKLAARKYFVDVFAQNNFGAIVQATYICNVSEDGQRVLGIYSM